jgi:hypothetical protein
MQMRRTGSVAPIRIPKVRSISARQRRREMQEYIEARAQAWAGARDADALESIESRLTEQYLGLEGLLERIKAGPNDPHLGRDGLLEFVILRRAAILCQNAATVSILRQDRGLGALLLAGARPRLRHGNTIHRQRAAAARVAADTGVTEHDRGRASEVVRDIDAELLLPKLTRRPAADYYKALAGLTDDQFEGALAFLWNHENGAKVSIPSLLRRSAQ